jgi:hypothetical protein
VAESTPAYVQVPLDGSGKKVRNVEVQLLQPDGTTVTVEMQVIAVADENGRILANPRDWQDDVLEQLKLNNELLARLIEALED